MEKIPENIFKEESFVEKEESKEETFRTYMENLELKPSDFEGKILDVGSGGTEFAKWAKEHDVSSEIYSLEPSEEIKNVSKGVRGQAEKIPFKDGSFDLVVSNSAIPSIFIGEDKESIGEHIKDSLEEFLRVSKDDGEIRLGRVQRGEMYKSQRELNQAFDKALEELSKEYNFVVNQTHTPPDTYEYNSDGNIAKLLAESFLVKIKKIKE